MPLLLCSFTGFDASAKVDALAEQSVLPFKSYYSVAMGSAEGFSTAENCITSAAKEGGWVLLRNVHLCPEWLVRTTSSGGAALRWDCRACGSCLPQSSLSIYLSFSLASSSFQLCRRGVRESVWPRALMCVRVRVCAGVA